MLLPGLAGGLLRTLARAVLGVITPSGGENVTSRNVPAGSNDGQTINGPAS